jgi:hypothetical protein
MKKLLVLLVLSGLATALVWSGCKKDEPKKEGFTCKIVSPKNGAELPLDEDITVIVEVNASNQTIAMVTVDIGGKPGGAAIEEPYTITIPAVLLTIGKQTIKAVAVTTEGVQAEASITVTIIDTGAAGDENESPNFVTFANGEIPPSWKTNTWVVDVAMGYDDNYSLRAENAVASVVTQKTMNVSGYVEFHVRGGDYFDLYINNSKAQAFSSLSLGNNWTKWVYVFEKGTHSFRWENNHGSTIHLDAITFARATLPKVATKAVINITATSATSGGNVIDNGNSPVTARGVCWSISENPTIAGSKTTDGTGTGSFTSNITGINQGVLYYMRAYATNGAGTAYGEQITFTTDPLAPPTVTTGNIINITISSAECGGNVTKDGYKPVTARGVCWSTSENPTIDDNKTTDGKETGSFTSKITGLNQGTLYYVRSYATNEIGTAYGEQKTFTTLTVQLPTVTTADVTGITSTTAKCGGNVTNDGNGSVTARGVCWSIFPNPTIADNKTTNGTGTGSFTSNITGLSKGTLYYVRSYATNSAGTVYGEQKSFTPKFAIGENYQGGVIAYIDHTGEHGLIAAKQDQDICLGWSFVGNTPITGATGTAIGTGKSNTTKIVQAQGNSSYAAKLCDDLVLNGYSDWFLPSKDELNLLYINRDVIGGFTNSNVRYWSSTEHDKDRAWYQHFNDGGWQDIYKKVTSGGGMCMCVRAVRYF